MKSIISKWNIVYTLLIIQLIVYGAILLSFGFDESSNRLWIRLSARLAGILFAFAFSASSLYHIIKTPVTKWLLVNRKYVGISFALTHIVHFIFLIILQINFHPVFELAKTSSLIGGGLAYLFIVVMLLTSFDKFATFLSDKNWRRLHTIGGNWIWLIFFRSYAKKVLGGHHDFWPFVILFAVVLLLRLYKLVVESRSNQVIS